MSISQALCAPMSVYYFAGPMTKSFLSACSSPHTGRALVARRVYENADGKPTIAACPEERQQMIISCSSSTYSPFKARRSSIMRVPTAHDITLLNMPSLHCTFPSLVHPHYHAVKEQCDAWIEALVQPSSPTALHFLHDCLLPLFICRMNPKAQSQLRLVHVIKMISWLMVSDDDDDHPDVLGSNFTTTSRRADLVMAILHKVDNTDDNSFDLSFLTHTQPNFARKSVRMLKAFAELWDEIRQEMSPLLQARFISTMADYFEGIKAQASFREEDCVPDVESYMEIRRQASFTIPIFVLMEYALGIQLDEATFYNPLIQELRNVVLDYISLCNDIVSCPIEISMRDYFNLPSVLYNCATNTHPPWKFTSFQNAVDHVAQMVEDLNTKAIFLISTIQEENKHMEPYMVDPIYAYLDGLSLCMSGALTWFYESARYNQPQNRNRH
uniref:Terpene synthase n=1 Tax=Microlepia platyphylla TaxID=37213 RepID=A0A7M3UPY8_MICPL|nr:MTPSL [Microlepia platyphylla]